MNTILKAFPFAAATLRDVLVGFAAYVFETPGRGIDMMTVWEKRLRDRAALRDMDSHLLRDIGLAPEDAAREAAKPFWRA